jgi:Dyp-type peroxidase family
MPDEVNSQTPPRDSGAEPIALELDDIQGDILLGLQKLFERFIFFKINDLQTFQSALREGLAGRITSTADVRSREAQLAQHKAQGRTDPLPLVGLNLGFTRSGLLKLAPAADPADPSFKAGALAQAAALGDPATAQGTPATWLPQFLAGNIDGVFLITGGTKDAVDSEAEQLLETLGAAATVIYDETGSVRPDDQKGHEHFGFHDGISQPGVNGLTAPLPGQRMLDPGLFVFGYPGQPAPAPAAWMKNGSFMVFRRLNQLVLEFEQFILAQSTSLGMDPALLAARLVGRWKSGAPLDLAPAEDDPTLASDPERNNNFDFSGDPGERRCPFGAHIRKTNPRADLTPQERAVDPHRIMRQGIPFGPEVSPAEETAHTTQQERGLMFVCYQTSIPNQFEFLQISWANNPGFVFGKQHPDGSPVTPGHDPIIGQNNRPDRARFMDEPVPNHPAGDVRSTLQMPQDFVVPTGGAYFFVPSISALKNELCAGISGSSGT